MVAKRSRQRKVIQIDPKTIKKHSDIAKVNNNNALVAGDREKTKTGFIVPGYTGPGFETYFEVLMPGAVSDRLRHAKKNRVLRVVSGVGFVISETEGEQKEIKIKPGDEFVCEAGSAYRVCTTNKDPLSLFVVQDSKYLARLEVLEESTLTDASSIDEFVSNMRTQSFQDTTTARKGSKAKEQLVAFRKGSPVATTETAKAKDSVATVVQSHNVRPSMGNFDAEGAG